MPYLFSPSVPLTCM